MVGKNVLGDGPDAPSVRPPLGLHQPAMGSNGRCTAANAHLARHARPRSARLRAASPNRLTAVSHRRLPALRQDRCPRCLCHRGNRSATPRLCHHRRACPARCDLGLLTAHRSDLVADRVRMINRLRDGLTGVLLALERAFDCSSHKTALVLLTGYQTLMAIRRRGRARLTAWLSNRRSAVPMQWLRLLWRPLRPRRLPCQARTSQAVRRRSLDTGPGPGVTGQAHRPVDP